MRASIRRRGGLQYPHSSYCRRDTRQSFPMFGLTAKRPIDRCLCCCHTHRFFGGLLDIVTISKNRNGIPCRLTPSFCPICRQTSIWVYQKLIMQPDSRGFPTPVWSLDVFRRGRLETRPLKFGHNLCLIFNNRFKVAYVGWMKLKRIHR